MIINETQYGVSTGQLAEAAPAQAKPKFFSETLPAAFRMENELSAMTVGKAVNLPEDEYDPDYFAMDDLGEYAETEYASDLVRARNKPHMEAMKYDIEREVKDRKTLDDAGGLGTVASVIAGVASPTTLIPAYGIVKGARGVKVASSAFGGAMSAAGAVGVSEALLQQSQMTRTPLESTMAVSGGFILGGALGGAASRLTKAEYSALGSKLEKDISSNPMPAPSKELEEYVKSVGAAESPVLSINDLAISGAAARQVSRASRFLNPFNRLANSPFETSRETLLRGFETALEFNLHRDGKTLGPAAETEIKLFDKYNALTIEIIKDNYKALKKTEKELGRNVPFEEYRERVSRALRNGDYDQEIKAVTDAARRIREAILEPIKKSAIELKMLPDDVTPKFAQSYLHRMWHREKLIQYPTEAKNMFRQWATDKIAKQKIDLENQVKSASGDKKINLQAELNSILDADGRGISESVELAVDDIYATLTGIGAETVPAFISPLTRGPLKGKTLDIPDNVAEAFLENDAAKVLNSFVHKMGSEISLTRQFGRADLKDQFDKLGQEFQKKLEEAKTPAERKKLAKQYRSDKSDLEAMRDLLRGNFNKSDPDSIIAQGGIALRDLTYMTSLGGVTASSLPDMARHVMVDGIQRSFGDLLNQVSMSKELRAMQIEDLKDAGFMFERILASRLTTLADVHDPLARGSMLTRFTGNMAQGFSKLTLINHWNDIQKAFAATMTQNRIMKALENGGENSYLRYLGIDEASTNEIMKQYKKFGQKDGRAYIVGFKQWEDTPAARRASLVFKAALRKEADIKVVTKGVADAPIMSNTPIGKLLFQFTGYLTASHQRLLLRGLQQADAGTAFGILMMVGMGTMVAAIKQMEVEKGAELSGAKLYGSKLEDWDTAKLLYEGVDRSGLLGVVGDFNNRFEKLGGYGITRLAGVEEPARYTNRSKLSVFLGPAAGKAENLMTLGVYPFQDRELTDADIRAMRTSIPFQNVTGIRFLFDSIQGNMTEE